MEKIKEQFANLLTTTEIKNNKPTPVEIKYVANFIEKNWEPDFKENYPSPSLQWMILANRYGGKTLYNNERKLRGRTLDLAVRTYLATGQINASIANV